MGVKATSLYVCMYVRTKQGDVLCMCVCMYVRTQEGDVVCMYVCMYEHRRETLDDICESDTQAIAVIASSIPTSSLIMTLACASDNLT